MSLTFRLATAEDTDFLITLQNLCEPDAPLNPVTFQALRDRHGTRIFAHMLMRKENRVVGALRMGQVLHDYQPEKVTLRCQVLPAEQRRGYGAMLFQAGVEWLRRNHPEVTELRASVRENQPEALAFAASQGFMEKYRKRLSACDLQGFSLPEDHAEKVESLRENGLRLENFASLVQSDPLAWEKLYDLDRSLQQDVPSPDPEGEFPFEDWKKVLSSPDIPHSLLFVIHGGERYLAMTGSSKSGAHGLFIFFTGVRREFRGRGLAKLVKLAAQEEAKKQGFLTMETVNHFNNPSIIGVNNSLGYREQPASLSLVKLLR